MFAFHFVAAAAATYGAAAFPSGAWAYIATLLFGTFALGLLRVAPATFLLFVPLLALRLTEFLSGAAIENGAYMVETTTYGHPTGGFCRLLLIYLVFFAVATAVVESSWPRLRQKFIVAPARWQTQAKFIWIVLVAFAVAISAYLLRLGINNGTPLFSGIDRFAYLDLIDSPIYRGFMYNRIVLIPFVGALFATPGYRARALGYIVWLIMTSVIFGEKFTSLVMIISLFAIPAGLVHIANERPIPVGVIAGISAALVVVTVPAILIVYGALRDFDGAVQRYGNRAALQGQLWYQTDLHYLRLFHLEENAIGADMASWINPAAQKTDTAGTRFGLYYVMQPFTASRLLGWTQEGGTGFVFSLYPYFLRSMGVIGLLIVGSIVAAYHALVMRLLASALAEASWLAALLFGRVMSMIYATYTTGYMWNTFGLIAVIYFLVGVFLLWESRLANSRTKAAMRATARRVSERFS
ncbi:MAG: DUF6418 domain-containing protein [Sphingomonas phyllosphaerae]|uniref:DUF6418 domain-containing protein n=1 Tax=Sphingomonas phyllosphaerae TaxID=257003 RepID=UPI002FF7686A